MIFISRSCFLLGTTRLLLAMMVIVSHSVTHFSDIACTTVLSVTKVGIGAVIGELTHARYHFCSVF